MCATHNITISTKKVIERELKRASDITKEIFDGKKRWSDLFQRHAFFSDGYKYYLSIVAASKEQKAHAAWSGLVGSKVRRLVGGIEQSDAGVELAHPFNKGFDRMHRCRKEEEIDMVCQGSLKFQAKDVKTEVTDTPNNVKQETNGQMDGTNEMKPGELNIEEQKLNGSAGEVNEEGESIIYTTTYYVGIERMEGKNGLSGGLEGAEQCRFQNIGHF